MKKTTLLLLFIVAPLTLMKAQNTCANAVSISSGDVITVDAINGTKSTLICDDTIITEDITSSNGEWYSFTATVSGYMVAETLSEIDTYMAVYSGICGALECVGFNDDIALNPSFNLKSRVTTGITSGTTYFIYFENRWSNAGFDFSVTEFAVDCDTEMSLPYSETFENQGPVLACWTMFDADGDGITWGFTTNSRTENPGYLTSQSYDNIFGIELYPDNWAISSAIDLTSFSSSDEIKLSWEARGGTDIGSFADDNYTVYAASGNTLAELTASAVSFSENIGQNGGAGTFVSREMDISSLAGEMIYIAFRHYNSDELFELRIDNLMIDFTLSSKNLIAEQFAHYYQPSQETLTVKSSGKSFKNLKLFNQLGQMLLNVNHQNALKEVYNLNQFSNGTYIARIEFNDGQSTTFKFPKY